MTVLKWGTGQQNQGNWVPFQNQQPQGYPPQALPQYQQGGPVNYQGAQ